MLHANFVEIGPPVPEKKILKGLIPFDPDVANKLLFPLPREAPHKIWL